MPVSPSAKTSTLWVDADSLPRELRDLICKAAVRRHIKSIFVANHSFSLPKSPWLQMQQVAAGFDVADNLIAQQVQVQDLVITQDIPLAAEVLALGAAAINTRGEAYNPETVRQKLNLRDFMETLRSSGIQSGGAAPFSAKDKMLFANALDRWLTKTLK